MHNILIGRLISLPILILFVCFGLKSQNKHWVFSVQKDPLWDYSQTIGTHLKHDREIKNNNYWSAGLGIYKFTSGIKRQLSEFPLLNLAPEWDFPLRDKFDFTSGNVGIYQYPTPQEVELNLSLFVGFGRNWLHKSNKWNLFTDLGIGLTYEYIKMYGFGERFRILNEGFDNEQVYEYWGYAILREIRITVHFNIDLTYQLSSKVGVGINSYWKSFVSDGSLAGFTAPSGFHIRYTY